MNELNFKGAYEQHERALELMAQGVSYETLQKHVPNIDDVLRFWLDYTHNAGVGSVPYAVRQLCVYYEQQRPVEPLWPSEKADEAMALLRYCPIGIVGASLK